MGTQFHPELTSRPFKPHPLFREFLKAADEEKKKNSKSASSEIGKTRIVKKLSLKINPKWQKAKVLRNA